MSVLGRVSYTGVNPDKSGSAPANCVLALALDVVMLSLKDITRTPNLLADDYRHAAVGARILLTGHIHQALPDVAYKSYEEHWDCFNKYGEEGWDEAFDKMWQTREGFSRIIDCQPEHVALASSVHELFVRFLSILPLQQRPRIITTDAEHPTVMRQLRRMEAEGVELVCLPSSADVHLVERIVAELNDRTAAVCISSVNFETGHQTQELDTLMPRCQALGVELFVDAYLSVNVLSFSVQEYNLQQAFIVGGGSKYCQLGSGVCFMHVPQGRDFQPLVTGWFGHFDPIMDNPSAQPLVYADGALRFDGSTMDALPYFRACQVFSYFRRMKLTAEFLHDVNLHQVELLTKTFTSFDFDPKVIRLSTEVEYMGGFVAFETDHAQELSERLRDVGVHTDFRRRWLRMGPAPYLNDEQLQDGIHALEEAVKSLSLGNS